MSFEFLVLLAFPALLVFAAAMDVFTMTIPNRISLALLAAFGCAALLAGLAWDVAAMHLGVGFAVLVVGIGMFAAGWMGGGDVKLMAAASVWMGPDYAFKYLLIAALAGGGLTLAMLYLRRFPLPSGIAEQPWAARLHDAGRGVPYGIALAASGLILFPHVAWVQALY